MSLRFLAISGSLRAVSSNSTLLRAAAKIAPAGVTFEFDPGVGELPHFNPDLDGEGAVAPHAVAAFRERIRQADAILVSCPEYIHGVPGAFKNALDWTASSGVFMGKPVALINASATADFAQAALIETLTVLMADVAAFRIALKSNRVDLESVMADPTISEGLRQVIGWLEIAARVER